MAQSRAYVRGGACACMCAGVDVPPLFPYHPGRIDSQHLKREAQQFGMTGKLTRKQIREGFDTIPMESILGKSVSKELTAKQKAFAREVASGSTKADAYRKAYKANPAPSSLVADPYRIAANPRVRAEIEAYEAAIEAARYRTPAALRELVIQSLVSVVINPETKDSVKVAAAKVLGTVTEVAAFTERKEVRTISSSDDARTKIMGELKRIINESATDATIIETQADELLRELGADSRDAPPGAESGQDEPHPGATPRAAHNAPLPHEHTIPPKLSDLPPISDDPTPFANAPEQTPPPENGETPPSVWKQVP